MEQVTLNPSVCFLACIPCVQESRTQSIAVGLTHSADLVIWCMNHDQPIKMISNGQIDKVFKEIVDEPCDGCGEPHHKHYKEGKTH